MKLFLVSAMAFWIMPIGHAEVTEADLPIYTCECFQSVPFESYQIYVVTRQGNEEFWELLEERPTQYDDMKACGEAIEQSEICQSF